MFPLTHLHVNRCVWGALDPEQALGSVLPDLLTSNRIAWHEAHAIKRPSLLPRNVFLSDAMHGTGLPGLDFYTDQSYRNGPGYAFEKAKPLQDTLYALGLPWKDTLWRGHNIVEMAIEIMIGERNRSLYAPLRRNLEHRSVLDAVEDSLSRAVDSPLDLATPLSLFLSLDAQATIMSSHYADKLNAHYHTCIRSAEIETLVTQAKGMVGDDYEPFLCDCVRLMRQSLIRLERSLA